MTKLINGDCIEEMKKLKDNSIDLLFTDLPYTTQKKKCTSCSWDKPIDLDKFWKEVNRICKINCPMFFCCNTRFGVELINSNPKNYRYEYIWSKSRKVGFLNSSHMRLTAHELIYVFYRKLPVYNVKKYHKHKFLKEPDSVIRDTSNYKNDSDFYGKIDRPDFMRKNNESCYIPPLPIIKTSQISTEKKAGVNNLYGDIKGGAIGNIHGSNFEPPLPDSLLEIKSVSGKHSTQKPVDLISFFIKYYSNEGDTILDPTMGSGSTGLACKELNRNFIGIELNEKIFKVAEERLN